MARLDGADATKHPLRGVQNEIFSSAAKRYFVALRRLAVRFNAWSEGLAANRLRRKEAYTMTIRTISTLAACVLLSVLGTAASANPPYGTITGHVRDTKNNPLIGAQVKIVQTGEVARTDSSGSYTFVGEDAGIYTIQARTPTYQDTVSPVVVKPNAVSALDFSLVRRKLGPNERRIPGGIVFQPGGLHSFAPDPFANLPQTSFQGDLGMHSTARSR